MSISLPRSLLCCCVIAVPACGIAGCRETPKPSAEPSPVPRSATTATPLAAEPAPTTGPSEPAVSPPTTEPVGSRPAPPAPEYVNEPPFRVDATVTDPNDPQAGWLRIEALTDPNQPARIQGRFPEPNKMQVQTTNVAELSVDLSMLPIQPGRWIILQIDKQAIDLAQRYRGKRVRLVRAPTGQWSVLPEPPRK